ncbi:MAG: 16S rRNA (guanine(527)-N(7))-methyltransferase RsmG [candidate division Zixibacteria bacterium]|nr:16S rRNA (guanine(527)-N(7))-methyltransferase RsmG [candidate division Zixibacteria bacterium]
MSDKDKVKTWLGKNRLNQSQAQIDNLLGYIDMIRETSSKMNLVSKNDLPQLIERHLLDSLHALTVYTIPPGSHIADLGSGAGFPGIPIAIARPDTQMDLVESRHRKCLFLGSVIDKLKLSNAKVIHDRWENRTNQYDIILARASLKEQDLITKALPKLNPGGVLLYFAKYNNIKIITN